MRNYEILIKTFLRPKCLYRLLDSIKKYYPDVTVRVCDDGNAEFNKDGFILHRLPFYSGLAVGKNYLVSLCEKDYFVLMDDDFVVTAETDLDLLYRVISSKNDIAIVAGRIRESGIPRKGMGHIEVSYHEQAGRVITRYYYGKNAPTEKVAGVHCVPCRMTAQLIMGSKKIFDSENIHWRDELKRCEHYAFFLDLPKWVKCYTVPTVFVNHCPDRPKEYDAYKSDDIYKRMTGERKLVFRDLYE